jgi:putative transposase
MGRLKKRPTGQLVTDIVKVEGDYKVLENLACIANGLWNCAIYQNYQRYTKEKKFYFYAALCNIMKDNTLYRLLPSQSAQGVLQKVDGALKSFIKLKKKDPEARPPGYHPKNSPWFIPFKSAQFRINRKDSTITLTMSLRYRKEHGMDFIVVKISSLRHKGKVKYLELYQRDGLWFASVVLEMAPVPKIRTDGNLYIDLGIPNLVAVYDEKTVTIYKGGEVSSFLRYREKNLAKMKAVLATHGKRTSKAQRNMSRKQTARASHAIHAMTKDIVARAKREGKGIVVGDLTHIRKHMKFKDQTNQKVHQWQFAKTTKQLEYKGGYAGVPFDTGSEVDTSATCCLCGIKEKGRVKRGLYRCKKYHVQFNADGLGAINISKRYRRIPLRIPSGIGVAGSLASPVVVLWDNHRWVPQDEANPQTVRIPRIRILGGRQNQTY